MRNNRLPDNMTGRLLQSLHWHLPINLMLLIIYLPVKIASVVIIIGFMIIFATALFVILKHKAGIPMIALSIYTLLAILSLYVSTRRFQD